MLPLVLFVTLSVEAVIVAVWLIPPEAMSVMVPALSVSGVPTAKAPLVVKLMFPPVAETVPVPPSEMLLGELAIAPVPTVRLPALAVNELLMATVPTCPVTAVQMATEPNESAVEIVSKWPVVLLGSATVSAPVNARELPFKATVWFVAPLALPKFTVRAERLLNVCVVKPVPATWMAVPLVAVNVAVSLAAPRLTVKVPPAEAAVTANSRRSSSGSKAKPKPRKAPNAAPLPRRQRRAFKGRDIPSFANRLRQKRIPLDLTDDRELEPSNVGARARRRTWRPHTEICRTADARGARFAWPVSR